METGRGGDGVISPFLVGGRTVRRKARVCFLLTACWLQNLQLKTNNNHHAAFKMPPFPKTGSFPQNTCAHTRQSLGPLSRTPPPGRARMSPSEPHAPAARDETRRSFRQVPSDPLSSHNQDAAIFPRRSHFPKTHVHTRQGSGPSQGHHY